MKYTAVFVLALFANSVAAQSPQSYDDGSRGSVMLPLGDLSFADEIIKVDDGDSSGRVASAEVAEALLGAPDYTGDNDDGSFLTLGCGGSVEMAFTDNAIVDVAGPDLYVFEVGPDIEGTFLAVSTGDGVWIDVGKIAGGRAEIDLADTPAAGGTYRSVRLTDDGVTCRGRFPGADIDAVAAIGSELRFTLDGAVLFDTGSSDLKPTAEVALQKLADQIADAGIITFDVIGHTDSVGSDASNQSLSEDRANAVRAYFASLPNLSDATIDIRGAGESEPVASNETDAGRAANRRVEIIARSGG